MLPRDFLGSQAQNEDVNENVQPPELPVLVTQARPAGTGGNGNTAHGEKQGQLSVTQKGLRGGQPQRPGVHGAAGRRERVE